jgi:hypothetical protein
MKVSFVAGFGPIVRDVNSSHAFWGEGLGIDLKEAAPDYWTNDDLDGVKAFGLWPLSQAAQSCFAGGCPGSRCRTGGSRPSGPTRRARGAVGPDYVAAADPRGSPRRSYLHPVDAPKGARHDSSCQNGR